MPWPSLQSGVSVGSCGSVRRSLNGRTRRLSASRVRFGVLSSSSCSLEGRQSVEGTWISVCRADAGFFFMHPPTTKRPCLAGSCARAGTAPGISSPSRSCRLGTATRGSRCGRFRPLPSARCGPPLDYASGTNARNRRIHRCRSGRKVGPSANVARAASRGRSGGAGPFGEQHDQRREALIAS